MITSELKFNRMSFEGYMHQRIVPIEIISIFFIFLFCTKFTAFPTNFSSMHKLIVALSLAMYCFINELIFNKIYTRQLINKVFYWESTGLDEDERLILMKKISRFPFHKEIQVFTVFFGVGTLYAIFGYLFLHVELQICIYYLHLFVSVSYIFATTVLFLVEAKCSSIARKVVKSGLGKSDIKFFGFSLKGTFLFYLFIPTFGTILLLIHTMMFIGRPHIIHSNGSFGIEHLSILELSGIFTRQFYMKSYRMQLFIIICLCSFIAISLLIYFYFTRLMKNTKMTNESLNKLRSKQIDSNNLFPLDLFSENSYATNLINKTILLFDSIIRKNSITNRLITETTDNLQSVSSSTKDNVIQQSANIEEILATMQNVDHLSKKVEKSFDEMITVAAQTLSGIDYIFTELNKNKSKIQEITNTNQVTISNLHKLSVSIRSIQDMINIIEKIADQTKTIAFNAELQANNIELDSGNFDSVAGEIRKLTNATVILTEKVHEQIIDITATSFELIKSGNYCMEKTNEGNEICDLIEKQFEDIKTTATETSIRSRRIKDTIHEETNSLHQIVETLSQITKSVKTFGESATKIMDTINGLAEYSKRILELNKKYNRIEASPASSKEGDEK
ncbi:MAG: methyl-accepting chemotaxis protein [Treponema sp.]|nr:methyl-accepting chemotaxis protein [Treponema sp.]